MKKITIAICTLAYALLSPSASAVTLIKGDEAKQPASAGVMATRGISRGPGVKLLSPQDPTQLTSPFDLKIGFEPRGGAQIDPSATKIIYLKAKPVDLLPRVKPGLSERGIELSGAETPPGEHLIQVTVQDSEGRVTNSVFQLNVIK